MDMPGASGDLPDKNQKTRYSFLLLLLLAGWGLYLWGIVRDLPYTPEIDEPIFVQPAIQIAATGDLNPHWFGNPGATTIYPLAGLVHLAQALGGAGSLWQPNPGLLSDFAANPSFYYILGRLLSAAYALLTLPLIYLLGRRLFAERAGLLAVGLFLGYPILLTHANIVRTDTAALFFVLLALWLGYRAADNPTPGRCLAAGGAIGLAIASRYMMVSLAFVYAALFALRLWPKPKDKFARTLGYLALGGAGCLAAFALSSPFVLLDWTTAWQNIVVEARSVHLGADGRNYGERFVWYFTSAIPGSIFGAQVLAALLGIAWAARQRRGDRLILAAFLPIFVATISIPSLHWKRWVIQILPVLALFAAHGLLETAASLTGVFHFRGSDLPGRGHENSRAIRLASTPSRKVETRPQLEVQPSLTRRLAPGLRPLLAGLLICAVVAQPLYTGLRTNLKLGSTSTRVASRLWIEENLPAGSHLVVELYTAPLRDAPFVVTVQPILAERPLDYYRDGDFDYLLTSSDISNRFYADPERYAAQIAFYADLVQFPLVQEFAPTPFQSGSTIRIFALPKASSR